MASPYYHLNDLNFSKLAYCLTLSAIHILVGSVVFDLVHLTIHWSGRSSNSILRGLARAHVAHHQYFDRQLHFNQRFSTRNLLLHLPLELVCQTVGSVTSWALSLLIAPRASLVADEDLAIAIAFLIIRSSVVAWNEGRDSNHITYTQLPKDPHSVVVGPQYHALHHIDPDAYFGSMIRLVDWVFGTATTLRGRRIAITGARGALGQALLEDLSQERGTCVQALQFGRDWNYEDYSGLESILRGADILVLAHGSKVADHALKANHESAVAIIKTFLRVREQSKSLLLPEVWYIGSEAELYGSWTDDMRAYTDSKRAFLPTARALYEEEGVIYRHIVPAAFSSSMGRSVVSAQWTAKACLWWIRRGACYVPVTYTGMAFLNFFRFRYLVTAAMLPWNEAKDKNS